MTVCIAVLFNWNYSTAGQPPKLARAAITASDRMITAADVQYEPQQQKAAFFGRSIVLVAGDLAIHSQAISDAEKEIRGRELSPYDIAQIYGRAIQAINRRQAENEILIPLGLNTDTFNAQQKDFSSDFVASITSQLQNRRPVDSEALVVGSDGAESHIYQLDAYGNDTCLDGVGFGAIGVGAWHAKSRLMQVGHASRSRFWAQALASIFAAKKNAEIAPGVGRHTDLHLVLKDGPFPVDHVHPVLLRLYEKYSAEMAKFGDQMVEELDKILATPPEAPEQAGQAEEPEHARQEISGETAQANAGAGTTTPEEAREYDTREEVGQKAAE